MSSRVFGCCEPDFLLYFLRWMIKILILIQYILITRTLVANGNLWSITCLFRSVKIFGRQFSAKPSSMFRFSTRYLAAKCYEFWSRRPHFIWLKRILTTESIRILVAIPSFYNNTRFLEKNVSFIISGNNKKEEEKAKAQNLCAWELVWFCASAFPSFSLLFPLSETISTL